MLKVVIGYIKWVAQSNYDISEKNDIFMPSTGNKNHRPLYELRKNRVHVLSPGGNTPQGTDYMAICLPSWKLSKLDEPDL